jgi:predicted anti-sigma-YlaC factor YlaD
VDCSEVLEQLADYLDEDARAELCRAIESHLSRCRDCRVEVDSVRKTIVLYQAEQPTSVIPASTLTGLDRALAREYTHGDATPSR